MERSLISFPCPIRVCTTFPVLTFKILTFAPVSAGSWILPATQRRGSPVSTSLLHAQELRLSMDSSLKMRMNSKGLEPVLEDRQRHMQMVEPPRAAKIGGEPGGS
jgi:hypothetical protein